LGSEYLKFTCDDTEQQKNLRTRILAFFEEMLAERKSWKARRKQINKELGRLRKRPESAPAAIILPHSVILPPIKRIVRSAETHTGVMEARRAPCCD
jgi:hypothetical protein